MRTGLGYEMKTAWLMDTQTGGWEMTQEEDPTNHKMQDVTMAGEDL